MTGRARRPAALVAALAVALVACGAVTPGSPLRAAPPAAPITVVAPPGMTPPSHDAPSGSANGSAAAQNTTVAGAVIHAAARTAKGEVTLALAGDMHFAERTATLLARNTKTALREAADQLSQADLTMVNLETAITKGGSPAPKQFHFRAPPKALRALAAGGVDVVTMANNHAVDYGTTGLADTLAAIETSPIPVLGIGKNAKQAYAPWITTVNGVRIGFLAASQVHDWTTAAHTATATSPGIASALGSRLVSATKKLAKKVDVVVVYLHWGIEYQQCPSGEQRSLADALAAAGATAVVGTHAHLLQGAGWRDDGVYVAYGLGNYYWWRSFGNMQDDNGVLTLTFRDGKVAKATFLPTRLDSRGVPQVATGATKARIKAQWEADRRCAGLAAHAPKSSR